MIGVLVAFAATAPAARAADKVPLPAPRPAMTTTPTERPGKPSKVLTRAGIRALVEQEAARAGLPPDIVEAVVKVESSFDPTTIGSVGEIGLMQVRAGTAAMMGFRGSANDLARPDINIHYGVTYLSKAWRLAGGDLCRALMKYRAGDFVVANLARRARPRFVVQTIHTTFGKAIAPSADGRGADADLGSDLLVVEPARCSQHSAPVPPAPAAHRAYASEPSTPASLHRRVRS